MAMTKQTPTGDATGSPPVAQQPTNAAGESRQAPAAEANKPTKTPAPAAPTQTRQTPAPNTSKPNTSKPNASKPSASNSASRAPPAKQPQPKAKPPAKAERTASGLPISSSRVGFTSYRSWQSHFNKHGHEFGKIDADEYLELAKALRDAKLSRDVIERTRRDGVITRFHRSSGDFIAFHKDKTIRTFFRPNDGEAYFNRQARR